jgi:hypothetical protein
MPVTAGLTRRGLTGLVLVLAGGCSTAPRPQPARTLSPGTLRIGTCFVSPFEYMSNGQKIGFEVDHERDHQPSRSRLCSSIRSEAILQRCRPAGTITSWAASPSRRAAADLASRRPA